MGTGAYIFGSAILSLGGVFSVASLALALGAMLAVVLLLHRNEHRLQEQADRAFCGY